MPPPFDPRFTGETARTWVDVDLGRIAANVRALRSRLPQGCGIMMTVKADAYGHGIVPVSRVAIAAGARGVAVAALDEVARLREAGIKAPIQLLMPILPAEAARAVSLDASIAISTAEQAIAVSTAAAAAGRSVGVHLDVDTGMGRTGVWDHGAVALAERIRELPGLTVDGIFTHFATADEPDRGHTERQLDRFEAVLESLEALGIEPPVVHVANSAAALRFRRARRTVVRPGIVLYGAAGHIPADTDEGTWDDPDRPAFEPALRWRTRVLAVKELAPGDAVSYHRRYVASREERIAVLGVGYGDGWPYGLSGRGEVVLRGRRVPIRGDVCMDSTMVDATPFDDLEVGEVATLIGRQGDEEQTVGDVGECAGLMSYAVFTGITRRVHRVYHEEERS